MKKIQLSGNVVNVNQLSDKVTLFSLDTGKGTFPVKVFGRYSQVLRPYLREGNSVAISGELSQTHFKTKDGVESSRVEILASEVVSGIPAGNNEVQLWGKVSRDPIVRVTQNGRNIAHVYVSDTDRNGKTHYFHVEAWDELAEELAEVRKGQRINVNGQIRKNIWEENGQPRVELRIKAQGIDVPIEVAIAS